MLLKNYVFYVSVKSLLKKYRFHQILSKQAFLSLLLGAILWHKPQNGTKRTLEYLLTFDCQLVKTCTFSHTELGCRRDDSNKLNNLSTLRMQILHSWGTDFMQKLDLRIGEPMQICIHRKDNSPKPVNHHLTLKEGPMVIFNIRRFLAQDFV